MRSRVFFVVLLLLSLSLATRVPLRGQAVVAPPANAPGYTADPQFIDAMAQAKKLVTHHQFAFAADSYKKANKLADGKCVDCLRGMYTALMDGGSYKDAANAASAMEAIAATPDSKSAAEYRHAMAVYEGAGSKPKPDKLQAAHGLLQEALGNYPKNAAALFLDGKVLAQLGRMDEAKTAFTQCVQCASAQDPAHLRAEHFAADPELSLHKMAPSFEVTALDGSQFNLDAMGGRVVLIDFWATWCGPCNAELPHMKKIAQEFAGQPLVIISVSWDADEAKWKAFLAKNEMTWVQYRDADHKLSEQFGVQAIPHYFTIDSDGVLTAEMMGSGSDVEGKLKKLLAKARESRKETATAATQATLPAPGN